MSHSFFKTCEATEWNHIRQNSTFFWDGKPAQSTLWKACCPVPTHRVEASFLTSRNADTTKGMLAAAWVPPCTAAGLRHPHPFCSVPGELLFSDTYNHAAESSSAPCQTVVVTTLLPRNRESVPKTLPLELHRLPCSFHDSTWIPRSRLKNVWEKNASQGWGINKYSKFAHLSS